MALPLAAISLGVQALGSLGSLGSAFAGASARRREAEEQARRFELGAARTLSATRAAGVASGVTGDSASLQTYLATMSDEFRRQAEWMRKTGSTVAGLGEQAGILGAAQGIGGALFQYGSTNNWFRQPTLATTPTYAPGSGMPPWR